eukprot:GHVU01049741.1.p3 GENE.GHVU01049741.1~~GHVU01049741.1.p3  ORF type:complete len:108 (+),score=3.54 GHVU01049741.1:84-407(+)
MCCTRHDTTPTPTNRTTHPPIHTPTQTHTLTHPHEPTNTSTPTPSYFYACGSNTHPVHRVQGGQTGRQPVWLSACGSVCVGVSASLSGKKGRTTDDGSISVHTSAPM